MVPECAILVIAGHVSTHQKVVLLFRSIFSDTLGFAGVEMIRRLVGQLVATTFVYCLY